MCKASRVGALCVWRVRSLYDQCRSSICDRDLGSVLAQGQGLCVLRLGSVETQGSVSIWGQSAVCDLVWGSLYEGSGLHVWRVGAQCEEGGGSMCDQAQDSVLSPRVGAPCVTTSLNEERVRVQSASRV